MRPTMAIKITLSSAAMGDVDELDFDLWARFVAEQIDEATGIEVAEVDQARFGEAGEDRIEGATEEQRQALRTWLSVDGWEAFCGQGGPWERMRADHEASVAHIRRGTQAPSLHDCRLSPRTRGRPRLRIGG